MAKGKAPPPVGSTGGRGQRGIDPQLFYPFDEFCEGLNLPELTVKHLQRSLQSDAGAESYVEISGKQRWLFGHVGIKHLFLVKDAVAREVKEGNRKKGRQRRAKDDSNREGKE